MMPQQGNTAQPSLRATNATCAAWIRCTCCNFSRTALVSPPSRGEPQATTRPSLRMAAKADWVAWISCTSCSCSCAALLSPPEFGWPQVTTQPSLRMAANANSDAWMRSTLRDVNPQKILGTGGGGGGLGVREYALNPKPQTLTPKV